jgi:hypothetical protein
MMKRRMTILLLIILSFVGLVFALPKTAQMKPSRLAKDLPERIGQWMGRAQEPGAREREVLALDTEFERMDYINASDQKPSIQVSIVFSGKNLSQSIHRPEVCLRAQGWEFMSERYFEWKGLLANEESFPVKEMICRMAMIVEDESGNPTTRKLPNGEIAYHWRVFYYTFLGHEKIMAGHYQRTGEDIKDRLLKGYDQRWAYVTISSAISQKYTDQGISIGETTPFDEQETQQFVGEFLQELLPVVVAEPAKGQDPSLSKGGILNYE